jgi:hypothetical protein
VINFQVMAIITDVPIPREVVGQLVSLDGFDPGPPRYREFPP